MEATRSEGRQSHATAPRPLVLRPSHGHRGLLSRYLRLSGPFWVPLRLVAWLITPIPATAAAGTAAIPFVRDFRYRVRMWSVAEADALATALLEAKLPRRLRHVRATV